MNAKGWCGPLLRTHKPRARESMAISNVGEKKSRNPELNLPTFLTEKFNESESEINQSRRKRASILVWAKLAQSTMFVGEVRRQEEGTSGVDGGNGGRAVLCNHENQLWHSVTVSTETQSLCCVLVKQPK